MIVIPAIDLRGGRCVRLVQGRFDDETVFDDDPVAVARRWEEAGAQFLHVVDLEGARKGVPQQFQVIERICQAVSVPIQLGGGLRDRGLIEQALGYGVNRVVIGTVAALDEELAWHLIRRFDRQLVIGVDARDGKVAVRGWEQATNRSAADLATAMSDLGARRVVYTDIGRDGMLAGVNLEAVREFVAHTCLEVIISGGVSSREDLDALAKLGVEGAIVGKALYTGALPPEAIREFS
jgi:phosphoribosylformimino-5-aminoimidazole carboxamide ribotide isomerase